MYGKLINGILSLAPTNYIKDNKTICNFDKSVKLLKQEGYKEIVLNKPEYDKITHTCSVKGYEDRGDYIECIYILEEKELNQSQVTNLALELLDIDLTTEIQKLSDDKAIQVKTLFPNWMIDIEYKEGNKVNYNGILYKVKETHVSKAELSPDISSNLFIEVRGDINE